jgi:hypothetical protein
MTMSFLKKLGSFLTGEGESGDDAYWFYVRCGNCGEKLRIRVNKQFDLQPNYETGGHTLAKEMMDSKCFHLMYARIEFDKDYRETSRDITGGEFITREEYEASG